MAKRWKASKDPQDVKDYDVNWAPRLLAGEQLSSAVWSIAKRPGNDDSLPLTINTSPYETTGLSKVWLSGGIKGTYQLLNHVVTNQGRQYDQTMELVVESL